MTRDVILFVLDWTGKKPLVMVAGQQFSANWVWAIGIGNGGKSEFGEGKEKYSFLSRGFDLMDIAKTGMKQIWMDACSYSNGNK